MVRNVRVDYGTSRRGRRQSRRDIARYWQRRYDVLTAAGFSSEESEFAAFEGMPLESLKRQIKHRRALVEEFYMPEYGYSREKAIEMAAADLYEKLQYIMSTPRPDPNIYYEISF